MRKQYFLLKNIRLINCLDTCNSFKKNSFLMFSRLQIIKSILKKITFYKI